MNNQTENIVYKDYTSSANECSSQDNSSSPDNLANIMKDNVVILQAYPQIDYLEKQDS